MQQNWLGKSTGTRLHFDIGPRFEGLPKSISVFTTRLDTLFGVRFLALSASHPLVIESAKHDADLRAFISAIPNLPEDSKAGYRIKNIAALNPLIHVPETPYIVHQSLTIWVAPYVMSDYGEGAIMGVPAHDDRDFTFWKRNCPEEEIIPVVEGLDSVGDDYADIIEIPSTQRGRLRPECKPYGGMTSVEASEQMVEDLKNQGAAVTKVDAWRLRDWLISRQRYWGTPIPIIHCKSCGPVPVPLKDLPVELPTIDSNVFKKRKGNPLEGATEWLNVSCPKCAQPARRDTDTMDTFVDSSWYMFRFIDPHNEHAPFAVEKADKYMPVDTYVGGIEHAILHLLYARFIGKFLAGIGLWPAGQSSEIRGEPFKQLISQGMVHGKTYSDPETGKFLKSEEVDTTQPSSPIIKSSQRVPNITFEKMSKSKYNGIDPVDVVSRYGADVTRLHMLFQAPVSDILEWEEARISGVHRWLIRLHKHIQAVSLVFMQSEPSATSDNPFGTIDIPSISPDHTKLYLKTERTISSLTTALADTHSLNTCISDLMTLTNELTSTKHPLPPPLLYHTTTTLIKLLAPFAPAFAEESWEILHSNLFPPSKSSASSSSLFDHYWPEAENLCKLEEWAKSNLAQACAIMENGKLRMVLDFEPLPEGLGRSERLAWAMEQMDGCDAGREWLRRKKKEEQEGNKGWSKIIVVDGGKAVNFVGGRRVGSK